MNFIRKDYIVFIVPLIVIVLLIIAGFYSFPAGDDYCYAFQTIEQENVLSRIFSEYQTGNGRYSSNFLVFNNPIAYGSELWYHLTPAFLLFFGWLGLQQLCAAAIKTSSANHFLIALSLLTVIVLQQPDITESLYWFTGAVTYFPAGCIAWILFSFLMRKTAWQNTLIISGLIFILAGFNETAMQLSLLFIMVISCSNFLSRRFSKAHFLFLTVVVVASCVVVFSPGNNQRELLFEEQPHFLKAFTWPLLQSIRFAGWYLAHPSVILISLLVIFYPVEKNISEKITEKPPGFYLLLLFITLYFSSFAPYYFTGTLGQHRTYNFAGMIFYPVYFAFLFSCASHGFFQRARRLNFLVLPKRLAMVSLLFIPFCYHGYFLFSEAFSGKWKNYYRAQKERETELNNALHQGEKDYVMKKLNIESKILTPVDTNGKNDWICFCSTEYYSTMVNNSK